jgi:hypothetical protein
MYSAHTVFSCGAGELAAVESWQDRQNPAREVDPLDGLVLAQLVTQNLFHALL